jgi:hypothetical protein
MAPVSAFIKIAASAFTESAIFSALALKDCVRTRKSAKLTDANEFITFTKISVSTKDSQSTVNPVKFL